MPAPLTSLADLASVPGPVFLSVGVFDGVHRGHRAVIDRALSGARAADGSAVAVTFDPHPARILRPDDAPRLLTSTAHKLQLIRALGVGHILVIPFNRDFANTEPADFVRRLVSACNGLREICVGHRWAFGKGRAGNLELLGRLGEELGFAEVGVPAVEIEDEAVSSTLIRESVEAGDLARAERMLGRCFSVLGTVMPGQQLGRRLGFPTANLAAHNEQLPPNGVYAVDVLRGNELLRGVANIGVRPTVSNPGGHRLLEVHLFDFAGDIYDEDLEVFFRRHLRPEQKFDSVDDLRAQIARDVAAARADRSS